ncbi:epoxide hydrolase family protein [Mesorhizobium sp.]|uniref:epoxide hydrolase family protein n=1 Tax=Mesorhizobium sp. TaxID=1871066 RepID=UPI003BABA09D
MTNLSFFPARRKLIATSYTARAVSGQLGNGAQLVNPVVDAQVASDREQSAPVGASSDDAAIRPFRFAVPEAALADLRNRIAAIRWPDRGLKSEHCQGTKADRIRELVRYWGTHYDWRRAEAKLNALPVFVTRIDGLDIQFVHVRSRHPGAMPLVITDGRPGSIFELLEAVGPLTDPTSYGGRAEEAFDLVLPSMPGHGFSSKPHDPCWSSDRIARSWDILMKRLGYKNYVARGRDWGSVVTIAMAHQAPPGLLGIHVAMPAEATRSPNQAERAPRRLSGIDRDMLDALGNLDKRRGPAATMLTRRQTAGHALADSPTGKVVWIYDRLAAWTDAGREPERRPSREDMLDSITLCWLANSGTFSAQLYRENNDNNFHALDQRAEGISIPVAVTVFPGEIQRPPPNWTREAYRNLICFYETGQDRQVVDWERPGPLAAEIRAAFSPLFLENDARGD